MNIKYLTLTAALLAVFSTNAGAAIVTAIDTSATVTAFDANISSTDLINTASSALDSSAYSFSGTFGGTTAAHDGSASTSSNIYYNNNTAAKAEGFVTFTFTLDTTVNTLGYDITSINSIYGWSDGDNLSDQLYDVEITTTSNTTYSLLTSVTHDPASPTGSSQVTITDDTSGVLASGVTGIRFTAFSNPNRSNDIGIIREFDVFGEATAVPEPSAFGLLAGMFGFTWVMLRRRRA